MTEIENPDGLHQIISGSDNTAWPISRPIAPLSVAPGPFLSCPCPNPPAPLPASEIFRGRGNPEGQSTLMAKCRWAACGTAADRIISIRRISGHDNKNRAEMQRQRSASSQSDMRPAACEEQTRRYRVAVAAIGLGGLCLPQSHCPATPFLFVSVSILSRSLTLTPCRLDSLSWGEVSLCSDIRRVNVNTWTWI